MAIDLPSFELPEVLDNKQGWGPSIEAADVDEGIPFAPFNKNDRFGRISDWTNGGNNRGRGGRGGRTAYRGRYPSQFGVGTGLFQYKHEDDESSFSLVDNKPKPKSRFGRRPYRPNFNNNRGRFRGGFRGRGGWRGRGGRGRGGFNNRWPNNRQWGYGRYGDRVGEIKDASVDVPEDWKLVQTLLFSDLEKKVFKAAAATNLVECGQLEQYNPAYDRVTPQASHSKALLRFESVQHFTATTSNDPIIERLAEEKAGNVYATDTILAVLMASTRSVISWDLLVRKENGALFFDKRPESKIDFLSVNENWNEILQTDKESVNHSANLSREATLINHNFSQQVLHKEKDSLEFAEENPFLGALDKGMTAASGAYHYRKFDLGENIQLVARCTLNAFCKRQGKNVLMTVRALNEFDSKLSGNVDWRQKLETQTGAVLATEMKNNSAKLARWTAETVLGGADEFRLGFVSRTYPKDSYKHTVLMSKRFEPQAFAMSVGVRIRNLWGVLKTIIEALQSPDLGDGDYLVLKDPNKPELRIHEIPENAFGGGGEEE